MTVTEGGSGRVQGSCVGTDGGGCGDVVAIVLVRGECRLGWGNSNRSVRPCGFEWEGVGGRCSGRGT